MRRLTHRASTTFAVTFLAVCLLLGACAADGSTAQPDTSTQTQETQTVQLVDEQPEEQPEAQPEEQARSSTGQQQEPTPQASLDVARPSTTGALHVDGARLVDAQGKEVVLRGVSTHGLAWFGQYVNQQMFDQLADWGANVVRLALYTEEYGGWCTGGDRDKLMQLVLDGVVYAREADLYVIVDWHTLSDADPTTHQEDAIAFFDQLTATLGDDPHVIYEVCNEPNGATTWPTVRAYAEQAIPVIRAHAPNAVCLVGTPEWCQRPELAEEDPLDLPNVMYTVHFYAATHGQWLRDRTAAALDAGLPVFVSEYGICDASGNGAIDEDEANAWMAFLDERGVSRVMWNLSNKAESSAIIDASCDKISGLSEDDLSRAGRWLVTTLEQGTD